MIGPPQYTLCGAHRFGLLPVSILHVTGFERNERMTQRLIRYTLSVCLMVVFAVAAGCKKPPPPPPSPGAPLGVLFTGWYGFDHRTGECVGGLGSTHWNDGPNTAGIVHTPLQQEHERSAFYCSADPLRVKYQLDLMEDAGIKVLLFSWWGWGDGNLDGTIEGHPDQWINRSLTEVLRQLKERNSPIKVAVLIEPFTYTQAQVPSRRLLPHQLQMVLEYLYANFYGPYPDQMFGYDGSPLVSTFDPMIMNDFGITKPTRSGAAPDQAIDWWPRTSGATVELVAAPRGGKAGITVVDQHVQVALATDDKQQITTRASDLVALVASSAAAAPLVGATLADATRGNGILSPVTAIPLTRFATLRAAANAGARQVAFAGGDGIQSGDLVQLAGARGGATEVARIKAVEGAGGARSWTLESPLRMSYPEGGTARRLDFRWTVKTLSSQERRAETDAEGWNWWLTPQQPPSTTISSDGVVFLNHRFSEYYLHMAHATYITWQWRDIDPMLTNGVYEKQWQWALEHRDEIRLLLLYSWNFYGELAQLEPSTRGPAPPEQEYLQRTKRYERLFQEGAKTLQP